MSPIKQDNFFMENVKNTTNKQTKKEKQDKRKKSHFFSYLYLFSFVFLGALFLLRYFIKEFSPDVDVKLGNSEIFTLNDYESDLEVKTIDERLKWIQTEDELPSIEPRVADKLYKPKTFDLEENTLIDENKKSVIEIPQIREIQEKQNEFKNIPSIDVVPVKKQVITKVYLGSYESLDEAVTVQNKINSIDSSISPFVKAINGRYIVQVGSFSDSERAENLAKKLGTYGLYPKVSNEN